MGCLSVIVCAPPACSVRTTATDVQIGTTAQCKNVFLSAMAVAQLLGTVVSVDAVGPYLAVDAHSRNVRPKVSASLICRVNIDGQWQYLMVEEGNVITIDGQYMKVLKA